MLPFWEQKCWGKVMHCFANEQASVSYLEVEEGWQCSWHYHRERANTFIVISGEIEVIEVVDELRAPQLFSMDIGKLGRPFPQVHKKTLCPQDTLTIASRMIHQFKVRKSGQIIEVYHPDNGGKVMLDDIVRFDVGGKIRD